MTSEELSDWLSRCGGLIRIRPAGKQRELFSSQLTPMVALSCSGMSILVSRSLYNEALQKKRSRQSELFSG